MKKYIKESFLTKRLVFVDIVGANSAMAQEGEKFQKIPEAMKTELDAVKEEKIQDVDTDAVAKAKLAAIQSIYDQAMQSDVINPKLNSGARLFDAGGAGAGLDNKNLANFQAARERANNDVNKQSEAFKDKQNFIKASLEISTKTGPEKFDKDQAGFDATKAKLEPMLHMSDKGKLATFQVARDIVPMEKTLADMDKDKTIDTLKAGLVDYDTMLASLKKYPEMAVAKSAMDKVQSLKNSATAMITKLEGMREHSGTMLKVMREMSNASYRFTHPKDDADKKNAGDAYNKARAEYNALSGSAVEDLNYTAPERDKPISKDEIARMISSAATTDGAAHLVNIAGQEFIVYQSQSTPGDFYLGNSLNDFDIAPNGTPYHIAELATMIDGKVADAEAKKMFATPSMVGEADLPTNSSVG